MAEEMSAVKRALIAVQDMKTKLAAIERARSEPIAIVGLACRLPGGCTTPEAFWAFLERGGDAVTRIPRERWGRARAGDEIIATPEQRAVQWGAFLEEPLELFEPEFFGISPREAMSLDPQQRVILELAWEALERAGQVPEQLMGSQTGVFLGLMTDDYKQMSYADPEQHDAYTFTGNGHCFPAGRLSYVLGLQGPSMTVDTACSSSLVAVHLASQALRNGECAMALAGGVSLHVGKTTMDVVAKTHALSPDGRCKTFDAQANGYARGEGAGVIVLKRLSDAQAAGDRVLALIRGSAVNQDGRSTSLTAPNMLAQQAMLRQALESARVAPEAISYVETHGTGTSLGDPIEVDALKQVIGAARADGSMCVLGAVKTNIGHLEAAAGIAGLIKTVLCLQHERIPPNQNFTKLNPRIVLEGSAIALATEARAWPRTDKPRFAGVSGFGMSGTNAHAILEEAPAESPPAEIAAPTARVLALSARTPESLHALAQAYVAPLVAPNTPALDDVTYTAGVRRSHFRHRLAVVGRSTTELADGLAAFVRGERPAGVVSGEAPGARRKLVFVFPGQGSQWLGMAQQLSREQPVFRAALETCATAIERETGWALRAELAAPKEASRLDHIDVIQPALFAIAVALAALWRSWGFEPDAVVGHSMGEVAAAHVAGALSIDDAARIICRRSKLLRTVSGTGAMAAVELSLDDTRAALAGYEHRLAVAVSNGPRATVISGEPAALDEIIAKLERQGVFCRRIKVDVASHSPLMDGLRPELERALAGVTPAAPTIAMLSTVTGRPVQPGELSTAYWLDNLRQPVLFAHAVRALIDTGHDLFVELSPHPILVPPVEEALRDAGTQGAAVGSLRREQDESRVLHEAVAALYAAGASVDWARLYAQPARVVPLPTYPWHRARFWLEDSAPAAAVPIVASAGHPLLGAAIPLATPLPAQFWSQALGVRALPYLADHRTRGEVVVPGAAFLEMALAAAAQTFAAPCALEAVRFGKLLTLPARGSRAIQLVVTRDATAEHARFEIFSSDAPGAAWTAHASGTLRPAADPPPPTASARDIRARCTTALDPDAGYRALAELGLEFGPAFQGVQALAVGDGELWARVVLPDAVTTAGAYDMHPALVDACLQAAGALWQPPDAASGPRTVYIPTGVDRVRVYRRSDREVWVHGRQRPGEPCWDLTVRDDADQPIAELIGVRVQPLVGGAVARPTGEAWLHVLDWVAQPAPAVPTAAPGPGGWLVLADRGGTGAALARLLEARGARCVRVVRGTRTREIEPGLYEVDGAAPDGFRRVLAQAFGDDRACQGVVHLWSLDAQPAAPDETQTLGVVAGLHLAQAVLRQGWRDPPRLWWVTRGAQGPTEGAVAPDQAPLWGLGRAIALDHPALRCACVDLGERAPDEAHALFAELWADGDEDQIALRGAARHVARLRRASFDEVGGAPIVLRADATYLVTGGLGRLGSTIARWMVARGARHLALLGRHAPDDAARDTLRELATAGAEVTVLRADVAQRDQLAAALAELAMKPPLRGVVHAAAGAAPDPIARLDGERLAALLAPKLQGAWHLDALTRGAALDFFVLAASPGSLLGAGDPIGDAFLDALAHARHQRGVPGLAIDAAPFDRALGGLDVVPTSDGLAVLDRLVTGPAAQVGVLALDARRWRERYPSAGGPLWGELLRAPDPATAAPSAARIRDRLLRAEPARRGPLLEDYLAEQLARLMRLDLARLDRTKALGEMGVDSLMSLELRARLEVDLGIKLAVTLLFTYPTVTALARQLLVELVPAEPAAPEPVPDLAAAARAREVEQLSDRELLALFDKSFGIA